MSRRDTSPIVRPNEISISCQKDDFLIWWEILNLIQVGVGAQLSNDGHLYRSSENHWSVSFHQLSCSQPTQVYSSTNADLHL